MAKGRTLERGACTHQTSQQSRRSKKKDSWEAVTEPVVVPNNQWTAGLANAWLVIVHMLRIDDLT